VEKKGNSVQSIKKNSDQRAARHVGQGQTSLLKMVGLKRG